MNIQSFDLTIIGGGMVGLALANALADSDLKVAVIEGRTPSMDVMPQHDIRVSALSAASKNLLTNIGAWPYIEQNRHQPYQRMQVWEKDSFGKIAFDASSINAAEQQSLGAIVENHIIQQALWQTASGANNITLFHPYHVQSIAMGERETWLTLAESELQSVSTGQPVSITSKLVVGADGANSWLRKQADIQLTSWDYGHHALVATIETDLPHDNTARQIFSPEGILAFLPLNEPNLCSIVWSQAPDAAQALNVCDDIAFNRALTAAFDNRLGYCQVKSARGVFPLTMRYAQQFAKPRIALIGDAAHTIHPLAGLGVNLGFLDAAALAQELLANHQQGKDIGAYENLRHFERWRKSDAMQMIAAMEGFKQLFAGSHPFKKFIRDVGLVAVDKLTPAKEVFIKHAMGLTGDLPELSQNINTER